MKNLIPHFVHEQFQAQNYGGRFQAATLFVDISGFTPLTETLMRHRKDGAEVLTGALNRIFGPLVSEVYARGGFISTFAGDAFTALFPLNRGDDAPLGALGTAFAVQRFFAREGRVRTRYGQFEMGVKVGLSLGPVEWGILGAGGRHTYFFRGPAVDACAQAEHQAETGEIVAGEEIWPHVRGQVGAVPVGTGFKLTALAPSSRSPTPPHRGDHNPAGPALARAALTPFVSDAVIDLAAGGAGAEFRQVANVFISFEEPPSRDDLNAFAAAVLELATGYGGYFNKLDFGDKGGVMLLLFGAPVAHENDLARAAGFLQDLRDFPGLPGLKWRAGLTCGTVYAGIFGGAERCEYTAIGDVVNLSARLMQAAGWGQVWTGATVAERLGEAYQVEPLGAFTFKGKSGATPVYRVAGSKALAEAAFYTGALVGRETELAGLTRFVQPIFEGRFAGVAYVYGEAGTGKSRLVYELHRGLAQGRRLSWFLCPADEILRQSLNPFKHLLRRYFDQSPDRTAAENKARFDEILDVLIAGLRPLGIPEIAKQLARTRSFLGALVGLRWEGSLYEGVAPKLRFENTLTAFKTLLVAESLRQPVVVQVEDLHWLDPDSQELIKTLVRNVEAYPIAVVCTSRYRDDGGRVTLGIGDDVPQQVTELGTLTLGGIQALAGQMLEGEITGELAAFLTEKTEGNPFFIEQLLLDLRERGAVVPSKDGVWGLEREGTAEVPTTINAVLIARLDRLAAQVRQVVQTAAVLGQEFEIQILSQMLKHDARLPVQVKQAEAEMIWSALSEMRYIFRHALMRDAAYDMQLRARLRELHRLAGGAIERVYAADLAPHYADLAYHYRQAEDVERERRYARLAGEQAAAQFANVEAVAYFSRALELAPEAALADRYALLLAREKVYDVQGKREAQIRDLATLEELAGALDDGQGAARWQAEVALRQANYAQMTGDFPAAIAAVQAAIGLAQSGQAVDLEAMGYLQRGQALWRQGDYQAARTQLQQALALAQKAQLRQVEADSLRNLGIVCWFSAEYAGARAYYDQALQICREIGDRQGESASLNNLGIVFERQSNYAEARAAYEQALRIHREIGHRQGMGLAFLNLGSSSAKQGDYAEARAYFERSLGIFREIGYRQGENMVLGNLGSASREHGDYAEAETFFRQCLRLHREIGDRRGEGWALCNLGLLSHHLGDNESAREYSQQALSIAQDIGHRSDQGAALTRLGHALAGLENLAEAAEAYRRALTVCRELGELHLAMEPLAGLARVSLAQGDLAQALGQVEEILSYLETKTLDGTEEPFRVYLTSYRVLRANQDPRAEDILNTAYRLLQERAAKISDTGGRRSFLENVGAHREIVGEWQSPANVIQSEPC